MVVEQTAQEEKRQAEVSGPGGKRVTLPPTTTGQPRCLAARKDPCMHAAASFGRRVRQARDALGVTHEVLADRTGCAVQTILKIEADERRPSQVMAERLGQALEVPPEERPASFGQPVRQQRKTYPTGPTRPWHPSRKSRHHCASTRPASLAGRRNWLS